MKEQISVIDYTQPSEERRFYLVIDNQKIFVDEQTYRDYMRPIWREKRNAFNRSRCMVAGSNGKAVRCTKDCSKCPFNKNDGTISLDFISDECNYPEVADEKKSAFEERINKAKYDKLYAALDSLSENQKRVIVLHVIEEKTFTEIGKLMNITRQGAKKHYDLGIANLKNLIKFEDFI